MAWNPSDYVKSSERMRGGIYPVPNRAQEKYNALNWNIDLEAESALALSDEDPFVVTFRPNLAYIGISLKRITDFISKTVHTNILGITKAEKDIIHSAGGIKDLELYSEEYGSKHKVSSDDNDSDEKEVSTVRSYERYRFRNAKVVIEKGQPMAKFLDLEFKKTIRFLGDPDKAWDYPLGNGKRKKYSLYDKYRDTDVFWKADDKVREINENKISYLKRIKEVLRRADGVANNYWEIRIGLLDKDMVHTGIEGSSNTSMGAVFFSCLLNNFDPLFPIRGSEFKELIEAKMGRIVVEELNRATVGGVKPRIEARLGKLARNLRGYVRNYIAGGVKPFLSDKTMRNRRWNKTKDPGLYAQGIDEAMYESGQLCNSIDCFVLSETRRDALRQLWSNLERVKKLIARRKRTLENYLRKDAESVKKGRKAIEATKKAASQLHSMSEEEQEDFVVQQGLKILQQMEIARKVVLKQNENLLREMRNAHADLSKFTDEQLLTANSIWKTWGPTFMNLFRMHGKDLMKFAPFDAHMKDAIVASLQIKFIRGEVDRMGNPIGGM